MARQNPAHVFAGSIAGTDGTQYMSENDQRDEYGGTREADQQPRSSPKANSVTRITRARPGSSRAPTHLPPGDSPRLLLSDSTNRRRGVHFPACRPGPCPHRGNDHGSSFANNRTLADIFLDARRLLFILSSCFLHASCPVGPLSLARGALDPACAADGPMFDAVDPAGARRPGSTCPVTCRPM
jgi:hypothetical protein